MKKIAQRDCIVSMMALVSGICTAFCGIAAAQGFPVKPLRIIVPFPPGGTADVVVRSLAQPLGAALGPQRIFHNLFKALDAWQSRGGGARAMT